MAMKAWQVDSLGEPDGVMTLRDLSTPEPGADQILVRVLASAANFPDVLMCRGEYQVKPPLPFTPGVELCGEVVALGSQIGEQHSIGARVLGGSTLQRGGVNGGFAQYALMPATEAVAAPAELDDAEATSLWIGYQSAWFGLHRRAQLQAGETLLVHAAAGGVGSAAVQLGKAAGARVIAVVGGPDKGRVATELGADLVIDRHQSDFVAEVNDVTEGLGADVIFDPVGGETYGRSTKCVAFEGRIVVVGFAGGSIQSAPLNHALVKNYSIVGLHWGLYHRRNLAAVIECHAELCRLVSTGLVRPLVSERLPLTALADGLQRLSAGTTVGRVVYDASIDLPQDLPGDPT